MPIKVFLNLKLPKEVDTSLLTPDKVHGLFFSLIGNTLATKLHEEFGNVKPYSLFCKELFRNLKTDRLRLEVNFLEDSLIPQLLSGLILEKPKPVLNINDETLEVDYSLNTPNRWLKPYKVLYEEIWNKELPKEVTLEFRSPTTFRRYNLDFPFPLAELLFKGLVKKWLKFSKIPIEVDLREYYQQVEIKKYNLKTKKIGFSSGGKLTVFEGTITYGFDKITDEKTLRWFWILLNYSKWSGIGRKTTMGLGMSVLI